MQPADPDFYRIGYKRDARVYGVEFMEGPDGFGVYAKKDIEPLRRARVRLILNNLTIYIYIIIIVLLFFCLKRPRPSFINQNETRVLGVHKVLSERDSYTSPLYKILTIHKRCTISYR